MLFVGALPRLATPCHAMPSLAMPSPAKCKREQANMM